MVWKRIRDNMMIAYILQKNFKKHLVRLDEQKKNLENGEELHTLSFMGMAMEVYEHTEDAEKDKAELLKRWEGSMIGLNGVGGKLK